MKKAQIRTIGTIMIVLIVVFLTIFIFHKYFVKQSNIAGEQITETTEDSDEDGVKNILDMCCCTDKCGDKENVDIKGCSPGDKVISCSNREKNGCICD